MEASVQANIPQPEAAVASPAGRPNAITKPAPQVMARPPRVPPKAQVKAPPVEPSTQPVATASIQELKRGKLEVRVQQGVAEILVDGFKQPHNTRSIDVNEVPAGPHRVELVSPYFERKVVEVNVGEGETTRLTDIELTPLPFEVSFDAAWPGSCIVNINGIDRDTLDTLGHRVSISRKSLATEVVTLSCNGQAHRHSFDDSYGIAADFPAPVTP
jgi:hypothetical protein